MAKTSRTCAILLRLLAMAAAIAAAVIMATSRETATFFNLTLEAKYSYTPSFKFFLIANGIAGVYSLIVLIMTIVATSVSLSSRWVILSDVTVAMLLTAAMASAGAIAEVGKKGNEHAGWLPICDQVTKYCNHVMGALISGFIDLLLYTLIVFYTISMELNPLPSWNNK